MSVTKSYCGTVYHHQQEWGTAARLLVSITANDFGRAAEGDCVYYNVPTYELAYPSCRYISPSIAIFILNCRAKFAQKYPDSPNPLRLLYCISAQGWFVLDCQRSHILFILSGSTFVSYIKKKIMEYDND